MQSRNAQRRRHRVAIAAASALLGGFGLAAPAAAQGVIGTGSGRAGATVALMVALTGVITGGVALARSGRDGTGNGRDGAIVALVLGLVGMLLAALHLATTTGAFYGAGNGRGGAIVALVLGLIGMVLGRLAVARSKRAPRRQRREPGNVSDVHGSPDSMHENRETRKAIQSDA